MIEITPLAIDKLKQVLKEEGHADAWLRIIAMLGPHGGVQYMLTVEQQSQESDTVVKADGLSLLVDSDSVPLLDGAKIDFIDGLMRSGFVISNPNVQTGGCACGGSGSGCGCGGGGGGGGCACGGSHQHS